MEVTISRLAIATVASANVCVHFFFHIFRSFLSLHELHETFSSPAPPRHEDLALLFFSPLVGEFLGGRARRGCARAPSLSSQWHDMQSQGSWPGAKTRLRRRASPRGTLPAPAPGNCRVVDKGVVHLRSESFFPLLALEGTRADRRRERFFVRGSC